MRMNPEIFAHKTIAHTRTATKVQCDTHFPSRNLRKNQKSFACFLSGFSSDYFVSFNAATMRAVEMFSDMNDVQICSCVDDLAQLFRSDVQLNFIRRVRV